MKLWSLITSYFVLMVSAGDLSGAQITVVYPRQPEPGKPVVYADSLDSTFVFGRIDPVGGELCVNGSSVPYTAKGAFLIFTAIKKPPKTKEWQFTLSLHDSVVATAYLPYVFQSELPLPTDTVPGFVFPRVVRVADDNSHTRAAPAGSYQLFPAKGTRLLATGFLNGCFEFRLSGDFRGYIERQSVSLETDSVLTLAKLGNGECRMMHDTCVCRLALSRQVPWSSELSSDKKSLQVTLFDTQVALDRLRYSPLSLAEDMNWSQGAGTATLTLRFRQPLKRGYDIQFANDSLSIMARGFFARNKHSLRGKIIVIDAGHGGSADGTIGPLGTREKDVTLRWAEMLAADLRRRGAIPVLTRETDTDVALYDRVAIAKRARADFFISLHANALPDGFNPLAKHGTGTYYYQPLSQEAAAIIHKHLVKATGLSDDGIYDASLAVVRPTAYTSVLIEAAYLMYPPEEELLRSDKFLKRLTKAVVSGLTEYYKR